MRMFLSEVQGPTSEAEFARGCAEILLPGLASFPLTVSPWTDGSDFYLHGFNDQNPAGLVTEVASRAGWTARTRFLTAVFKSFQSSRRPDCQLRNAAQ